MSVHQDTALDPTGAESDESSGDSDWTVCLWENYPQDAPRLLSPEELDAALTDGVLADPQPSGGPDAPPVHITLRHDRAPAARRHGRTAGDAAKRILDIVGALVLTLVLSPLLVVVVLALARDRGPILYNHRRTGRHGTTFGCLKFRTMVPNADQVLREILHRDPALRLEWIRDHKLRNDPRVTSIGRFLRRTSLDELPQLWNVLKGDMSLVGPRPVVQEEWARYGRRLDTYLKAKPGVTGLWQIMGRSDACYRRRVALDSYYVRKRSMLMDCYILLCTVKVVLLGRGAC